MASLQPHPARWQPLPLRRHREQVEMFRYDWNMANRADYGDDAEQITWEQAEQLWTEYNAGDTQRAAG